MSTHSADVLSVSGSEVANSNDSIPLDDVFGLLSNSRRRHAIDVVMEHENIDKGDLVDRVAELEYGRSIDEIDGSERHRVYVSLVQTHLDPLEEEEIITREGNRVLVGPKADELVWYLKKVKDDSLTGRVRRSLASLC